MKLLTLLSSIHHVVVCIVLVILVVEVKNTNAFVAPPSSSSLATAKRSAALVASSPVKFPCQGLLDLHYLKASVSSSSTQQAQQPPGRDTNFWIPPEKLRFKIFKLGKGANQKKVLNLYGLWVFFVSLITFPPWILALSLEQLHGRVNKKWDPNRTVMDKIGRIWANVWLFLIGSYPTKSGNIDMVKGKGTIGPCLYVANHGSWLDIAIICTVVQPVFKFIAKANLKNVPGIGQQLRGGKHILIDRDDKRSQLKTFKDSIKYLQKGVSLMAFPEGTRSKTGRLLKFKGGMFSMALKTGVPIVPLSISHSYAVWPAYALLPAQLGRKKLHVHVHDPIQSEGRTEEELAELVREAFMSKLPESQLPLSKKDD